jgi:hypothetical protein
MCVRPRTDTGACSPKQRSVVIRSNKGQLSIEGKVTYVFSAETSRLVWVFHGDRNAYCYLLSCGVVCRVTPQTGSVDNASGLCSAGARFESWSPHLPT